MKLKGFMEKYGNKEVEEAKLKELLGIKDSQQEPKYYLRSWVDGDGDVIDDISESEDNYLNAFVKEKVLLFITDRENSSFHKTQFTQEEIDNLPNQEFIKMLVKEEVR